MHIHSVSISNVCVHCGNVSVRRHKDELNGCEPDGAVLPGGRHVVLSYGLYAA
jgi:hypothetical protein